MYEEIIASLKSQLPSVEFEKIKHCQMHLGIFKEPYLTYMLNGEKTIESRFSKNKIMPYEQISKDDIVIIKKSSGNIVAYFTIKEVMFFDLEKTPIDSIKLRYDKQLRVDENFWFAKKMSKYATLIFIDKVIELTPFHIDKRGMQTWITFN